MSAAVEELAKRLVDAVRVGGGHKRVSERSGIPGRTLSDLMNGRGLKVYQLIALTEACGVSLEWLATGKGEMRPKPVVHISVGHSADRPEKENATPPSILAAARSIFAELYPLPDIELLKGALEGLGALATFAETVGSYRLDPTGLAIAVDMECRHALALTAKLLKDEPETVPDVPNSGAGWL